jgi:hypothetical protein
MQLRKIIIALLITFLLLEVSHSQQVCLHSECKDQLDACDFDCSTLMTKCTYECTLNSIGCLQKCLGNDKAAQNLLECSFTKCIYL